MMSACASPSPARAVMLRPMESMAFSLSSTLYRYTDVQTMVRTKSDRLIALGGGDGGVARLGAKDQQRKREGKYAGARADAGHAPAQPHDGGHQEHDRRDRQQPVDDGDLGTVHECAPRRVGIRLTLTQRTARVNGGRGAEATAQPKLEIGDLEFTLRSVSIDAIWFVGGSRPPTPSPPPRPRPARPLA